MRRLIVALALMAAFATGVMLSDGMRATARMFTGTTDARCIDGLVCVGAEASRVFGLLDTDRHGLTALFCDDEPNPNARFIFLDRILEGDRCPGQRFTVELRSPVTRTLIKVDTGRIVAITQGPLHVVDL